MSESWVQLQALTFSAVWLGNAITLKFSFLFYEKEITSISHDHSKDNNLCESTLYVEFQMWKETSDQIVISLPVYSERKLIGKLFISYKITYLLVFPDGSVVKNLPAAQETQIWSLGWEDLLEEEMATYPSVLAGKIPGTEEPGGATVHKVTKRWRWLSDGMRMRTCTYRHTLCPRPHPHHSPQHTHIS